MCVCVCVWCVCVSHVRILYSGTGILAASYMNMQLVCTSKIYGPSCHMNLGRVCVCVCVCGVCVCVSHVRILYSGTGILAASYMNMQLVCTSKNIWTELSYEFGPSCLIDLGRVGMGRVLCGPSWHGPSWFWAELSVIRSDSSAIIRNAYFSRNGNYKTTGIYFWCGEFRRWVNTQTMQSD